MCPQSLDIEILTLGEHRKQDFGSPQAVSRVDGLVKETPEDSPASQASWGHRKCQLSVTWKRPLMGIQPG